VSLHVTRKFNTAFHLP